MTRRRSRLTWVGGAIALLGLLGNGLTATAGPGPSTTAIEIVDAAESGGSDGGSVDARVAVSPLFVRLELVPRREHAGSPIEVRATVTNLSDVRLPVVSVSIAAPTAIKLRPADPRTFPRMTVGYSAAASWAICTTVSGSYALAAVATVGGVATESRPLVLKLDASARC